MRKSSLSNNSPATSWIWYVTAWEIGDMDLNIVYVKWKFSTKKIGKKKSIMVALSDFSEDNMGYFGLYAWYFDCSWSLMYVLLFKERCRVNICRYGYLIQFMEFALFYLFQHSLLHSTVFNFRNLGLLVESSRQLRYNILNCNLCS